MLMLFDCNCAAGVPDCPLIKIKSGADGQSVDAGSQDWLWTVSVWLWQDIIILFSLSLSSLLYSYCAPLLYPRPGHHQYLHISSQLPRIKTASNTIIFTTVHIFITVISQQGYMALSVLTDIFLPDITLYLNLWTAGEKIRGKNIPKKGKNYL